MPIVVKEVPFRYSFPVIHHFPFIDQDGAAGHDLPPAFALRQGGGSIRGVHSQAVRVNEKAAVGTEPFFFRRAPHHGAIVFDIGHRGKFLHVEVTAVDTRDCPAAEAEGAGTVGRFPFSGKDVQTINGRADADETDGLGTSEQAAFQRAIEAGSLLRPGGGEGCTRFQIIKGRCSFQERRHFRAGQAQEAGRQGREENRYSHSSLFCKCSNFIWPIQIFFVHLQP